MQVEKTEIKFLCGFDWRRNKPKKMWQIFLEENLRQSLRKVTGFHGSSILPVSAEVPSQFVTLSKSTFMVQPWGTALRWCTCCLAHNRNLTPWNSAPTPPARRVNVELDGDGKSHFTLMSADYVEQLFALRQLWWIRKLLLRLMICTLCPVVCWTLASAVLPFNHPNNGERATF